MPQTAAFLKQEAHAHHVIWTQFANKYGGIYRLEIPGHRFVVVSDPAILPAIIGRPGLPKWAAYQNVVPLVARSKVETLFTTPHSSDPMWKAVRKALNPAFSPTAIRSKFGLVVDKCLALADWLEQSGPNKDVEAQDLMARLTLDVVLMAGFGIASNTLTAPGPVPLLKELHFAMDESFRTFSEPVRAVVLKLLPFLPAAKEREAHFVRLYGIWDGWVKEMQARGPPAETDDSMWACITRVRDPSTGMPMEGDKLQAEVASLIVGGLDTTAQTCSFTLALLATHPEAQKAVAAELQSAGLLSTPAKRSPRLLNHSDLSRLPYLDAVVRESMRMFPVSASGLGRYTTEPAVLGGYLVPAGTEVQINYYAMQNVEANFPEPQRFQPERWLGHPRAAAGASSGELSADGSGEADPLARAFLPYSAGPRSCIGQPLAQMEVPTILAMVLGRFEKIVSSPFLRCYQTAKIVQKVLQLSDKALEIDWQLCEVLTNRFLAGELWEPPSGSIADWMWSCTRGGDGPENPDASRPATVEIGAVTETSTAPCQEITSKDMAGLQWSSISDRPPVYPESTEEAHARYTAALDTIADRHAGQNVLVVTHGEAVRRSVARLLPWATVYEVQHCGFTVARRERDAEGDWDAWELEDQDCTRGVSWVT
ncbi:hypothetical protein WJX75_004696 [Coccomyxa subellipsoidea]|uniref:Cytochrome P450 n=1 Tax=Coccomyxa subellipsoidea TaxID=248742 RepID=A0ABR2YT99_9CHLO